MKRGIAILLAALLLGLCACSPTGADASEPGGTQPGTQPATRGTETTAGTQQTQRSDGRNAGGAGDQRGIHRSRP